MTGRPAKRGSWWTVRAADSVPAEHTALRRLRRIQADRRFLLREMLENWRGWAFSLLFHAGVFVLLAVFIVAVPAAVQKVFILTDGYPFPLELTSEPDLGDIFADQQSLARFDAPPSIDPDKTQGDPGKTDLERGAWDFITTGGQRKGKGRDGGDDGGGDFGGLAGKDFTPYLHGVRGQGLDVVFVFDSTGSMGGIIWETKAHIRQLTAFVQHLVPGARVGMVTYRDLPEFDMAEFQYTTRTRGLTTDVKNLESWLGSVEPRGGGDPPEAVLQGLQAAMGMSWRQPAKKVIILLGDAPPRPENDGLNRVYDLCKKWHESTGGVVSCIDTSGKVYRDYRLMPEFKAIASSGGGEAMLLDSPRDLLKQLVVYIFGSKWKGDLDRIFTWYFQDVPPRVMIIGNEPSPGKP